jgi:hypothetical protein
MQTNWTPNAITRRLAVKSCRLKRSLLGASAEAAMELPVPRPNVSLVCLRCQEGLVLRMMLTGARDSAVGRLIFFWRHWFGLNISRTRKDDVDV